MKLKLAQRASGVFEFHLILTIQKNKANNKEYMSLKDKIAFYNVPPPQLACKNSGPSSGPSGV